MTKKTVEDLYKELDKKSKNKFIIGFQIYNTLYPVGKQVDENVIEREVDLNKSEELITVPDLKENSK